MVVESPPSVNGRTYLTSPSNPAETVEHIRAAGRCHRAGCPCQRPNGNIHCFTHEDPNPSLNVAVKNDGVVWRCYGGCEQGRVRDALVERHLWPPTGEAARQNGRTPQPPRERRWDIIDPETGEVLAVHCRRDLPPDPETGKKKKDVYWQPRGVKSTELPFYGAEKLPGAKRAVLCEGEVAADAASVMLAEEADVVVVGTVTGASSTPCDRELGRLLPVPVVDLWTDADEAGRKHMRRIGERLIALGHRDVRLLDPRPDASNGWDAADLLAEGTTRAAAMELIGTAAPLLSSTQDPYHAFHAYHAPSTSKHDPLWPVLDPAALHGLAGEVVRSVAPHTEADPVAVLATFMVMAGSAIGRTPHLMVGDDRHGVNEFVALVGQTAKARKGSSQGGPQRVLAEADPEWAQGRIQGGLSSGEGLLAAIADPVTRLNKKGEEEVVFAGSDDKRLLCIEEEWSQLLKVSGRQGNIVSEIVRRAWDSRVTLRIMTKTSPLVVTDPHVSIVGHITADELRRELDDTARANGFANRFLLLCVKRSKVEPFLDPIPPDTVTQLARQVRAALGHARRIGRVNLGVEARALWGEIYPDLSEGKPGLVGALTARAEAHALRLALLYALLDGAREIGGEHLDAALALVDYAEASARFVFGDATGDPIADRIYAALKAQGPMSQNDIYELFGRHVSSSRTGAAMETLLAAGRVRQAREETGGRPKTIWMVA